MAVHDGMPSALWATQITTCQGYNLEPIAMHQCKQSILQMSSTDIGHANKLNMCHKKRDED